MQNTDELVEEVPDEAIDRLQLNQEVGDIQIDYDDKFSRKENDKLQLEEEVGDMQIDMDDDEKTNLSNLLLTKK